MGRASRAILCAIISAGLLSAGAPSLAMDESPGSSHAVVLANPSGPAIEPVAYDSLDVEDHSGYSSEYIFGMTKGIMRSTLTPALKPAVLILTIPLDIAFLPFAAIGGFFR